MKYVIILVLVPLLLFAQSSSENFVLVRSVVDAGGAPSSSENFTHLSAFGQSSPLGIQSSENFILSPGFLFPEFLVSPLSPIQELVIKENQPDVNLWWEIIPGAISYSIYRDTISTFTPGEGNFVAETADSFYTDTNIIPSQHERYFYIVTSTP